MSAVGGEAPPVGSQRHSGATGGTALTYEELWTDPFVVVMIQCGSLHFPEAAFMCVG